jgi:primosomal protein N' (replication factor Y)
VPARCPECGSGKIGRFGAGTQQVEAAFNHEFAPRRALRMDQDTTVGRDAHARILDSFERGEASALIGTQMIAKGHDFANVTVAGVLAADLMLGISDFRAPERAFQLITQAAGRAGRGVEPGRVFIQAYNIDDFAIRHAALQDYPGFFRQEIAYRKKMGYPPFGSLCSLTVTSLMEAAAREKSHKIASRCRQLLKDSGNFGIQIMGPARAPVYRIRKRYRWRIVLKGPEREGLTDLVRPLQEEFSGGEAALSVDFDPYSLL